MMNKKNIVPGIICAFVLIFTGMLFPQAEENTTEIYGKVSYRSSQNIYVTFLKTEGINAGDTLFVKKNNRVIAAVVVKYLSATSCAGRSIGRVELKIGDVVTAIITDKKEVTDRKPETRPLETDTLAVSEEENSMETMKAPEINKSAGRKYVPEKNYSGRFSIQSISSMANSGTPGDGQRWRYSLLFNKNEFLDSKLSFSSYMTFSYAANQWEKVQANINNSLKIYNFTLAYKPDENTTFWLGRHLNSRVGNIGATDGLQVERKLGNYYAGLIVGSRPNYSDYSYNIKLFEYGGYLGRSDRINGRYMENVIGAFQQTNNMKTDRRFFYFQHSDNLIPMTSIFFSSEIDLYKRVNNKGSGAFRLTSLYTSIRFAPGRFFSVTASYDARRNVVYYETYKFLIDTLFQNELRQGFRISTNFRPADRLFVGLNAGYRHRNGDIKPSRNYGGYISYSNLPFLNITPSLNFTHMTSSYAEGTDFGGRISRYFSNDINLALGYRRLSYSFTSVSNKITQNILSADMSVLIFRNLSLSVNYEGVFENSNSFSRFFIDLTTRF